MLRKKIWDITKSTALILVMLVVGEWIVEYFVTPTSNTAPPTMEDRIRMEDQVDVAFIGASSFSDGVIPDVYDSIRGTTSFNYASVAQTIPFTYYAVKDLFQYCSPKYVFIEIAYNRIRVGNEEADAIVRIDRIRSPEVKAELITDLYDIDILPKVLFPSARYGLSYIYARPWLRLKPSYLKDYLKNGYAFTNPNRFAYGGRGYQKWNAHLKPSDLEFEPKDEEKILKELDTETCRDNIELLYEIDKICREHGAVPVWIQMPVTQESCDAYGGAYRKIIDFMEETAAKDHVVFINMQDDQELMKLLSHDSFKDSVHMNYGGAQVFTTYFANMDENLFIYKE